MELTVLAVGDVVGRPGRVALARRLPELVAQYDVDCVVVNAENAAGGSGLTPDLACALLDLGVDVITMGDHVYKHSEIIPFMEESDRILRPANYPPEAPGRGSTVVESRSGVPVAVVSLQGRVFLRPTDCPFKAANRVLAEIGDSARVVLVDIHAEATSEKIAMGWYLDGRVSAVFGTHTHVQTADERVLPCGTGYITDLGMTGPYESVLGRRADRVLSALLTMVPARFDVASRDRRLAGAVFRIDVDSGRALSVERVFTAPLPEETA